MNSVERFIDKFVPENYNIFLEINRKGFFPSEKSDHFLSPFG